MHTRMVFRYTFWVDIEVSFQQLDNKEERMDQNDTRKRSGKGGYIYAVVRSTKAQIVVIAASLRKLSGANALVSGANKSKILWIKLR